MINKSAVAAQTSPVQQMVAAAAGTPTLWSSLSNITPSPHHHHHPFFVTPASPHHHHQSNPWNHCIQEPPDQPWSQLLLGGLVDEDDKTGSCGTKSLENWEQKLLDQSSDQFQAAKLAGGDHSWSHQMMLMSAASSPKSCITTALSSGNNALDFSSKSSDLKNRRQDPSSECNRTATGGAAKKARIQSSAAQSTFKVRKEKLGDRITALHQIVSPFGKTDTASVLLEAIGYIRFLQSQIEALSLPYLAKGSSTTRQTSTGELDEEPKTDIRSRGLCLVPIACTLDVGSDINGADYWASAFAANFG